MTEPKADQLNVDFSNTEIAFSNLSDKELKNRAWIFRLMNKSWLVKLGSSLAIPAVRYHFPFAKIIIKKTIYKQFCGGTNLMECQPAIDGLFKHNGLTVLDYGAEGKSSEEDLDLTLKEIIKAVQFAASNASVPVVSTKITSLAPNEILEKWQPNTAFTGKEEKEYQNVKNRLDTLCGRAHEMGVKVFVDAEESWMQNTIDHLVLEMMKKYNRESVVVYNTFQMYRHDRLQYLKDSYDQATAEGYILGAKLVRGAYMEKERERAKEMGYPSPIQKDRESTDRDYNAGIKFCVERFETLASCNASHNMTSNMLQANMIADLDLPRSHPHLNFCQLYGMSDHITFNLSEAGYNVAKYLPYGPIEEVVPYLIRRAEENTSMTGDMSRELELITTEIKRRGI